MLLFYFFDVVRYIKHPIALVAYALALLTFYFIYRNRQEVKKMRIDPKVYARILEKKGINIKDIPENKRAAYALQKLNHEARTYYFLVCGLIVAGIILSYTVIQLNKPAVVSTQAISTRRITITGFIRSPGKLPEGLRITLPLKSLDKALADDGSFDLTFDQDSSSIGIYTARIYQSGQSRGTVDTTVELKTGIVNQIMLTLRTVIIFSDTVPVSHVVKSDTITGIVTDANGKGIKGAHLTLNGSRTTLSDENGRYLFILPASGPSTLLLEVQAGSGNKSQYVGRNQRDAKITIQ